jgi:uncharacterized protein involved in exopolysaccharide biosynthesis
MSQDNSAARADNEIDLFKLWNTLWRNRWLTASIAAAFALGSFIYASLLSPEYSANVLLSPVKEEGLGLGALTNQLGGLASLAGIRPVETRSAEALAVLKSRDFARAFIEDESLLPVLFARSWDATASRWKVDPPPDLDQAARFFVRNVREVEEDRSGFVTLSIVWRDPELAAAWANMLAARLNDNMRQRALAEAEANVKYLRREFESTSIVALQQSISSLLENQMQKLMLARGNAEFVFRVIDRAEVPKVKFKPRVILIVALATVLGAMLSIFFVLVRDAVRNRKGVVPSADGAFSSRSY